MFGQAMTASEAKVNPRNALPTSPMKMRAGCQLCIRNPALLPAMRSPIVAMSGCCVAMPNHAQARPATTACPPAMPSIPSMKL